MAAPADRSTPREEGCTPAHVSCSSPPPHNGGSTAAERLTDDLLVEILSRVPVMSLCRFKCVSDHWLSLIHHPDHRKKLPRTLAGFFHRSPDSSALSANLLTKSAPHFTNVSGRCRPPVDTTLSFLPNQQHIDLLDCCNGLLLCGQYAAEGDEYHYIVCNPATEEWVTLPDRGRVGMVSDVRLGFDPAMSPHFHVFVLLYVYLPHHGNYRFLIAAVVYSSETGRWRWFYKENRLNDNIWLDGLLYQSTVFLNGCLHFLANGSKSSPCLAAVDMEGGNWTTFPIPGHLDNGFLQESQGCLHYSSFQRDDNGALVRLVVYVLKDYDNKEWMLKHSVEISDISGGAYLYSYNWMVIHLECDLIFFTARGATQFMCYNMNSRQAKLISNVDCDDPPYLPYVPLYAELESLHTVTST